MMKSASFLIFIFSIFFTNCTAQQKKETYPELLKRISNTRDNLYKTYITSDSIRKDSIINVAQTFVFTAITKDIFNNWYGTPWSFYGQTSIPKQGSIACGYFVTYVLSDAGFNIPKTEWAQQASEVFIKKISSDIKRFYNRPINEVITYIKNRKNGIYIVGLDCHVGFIYKYNNTIKFVHSNYYQRAIGVMSESLDTKNPLADSKYRVIGRILDDDNMIKWLINKKIE